MITWWACPTSIVLVFHVSRLGYLESLLYIVQHTEIPHPPGRTTFVIIFYPPISLINLGKLTTYQSCIL